MKLVFERPSRGEDGATDQYVTLNGKTFALITKDTAPVSEGGFTSGERRRWKRPDNRYTATSYTAELMSGEEREFRVVDYGTARKASAAAKAYVKAAFATTQGDSMKNPRQRPRRNPTRHPTIDKRRRTQGQARRFFQGLTRAEKHDLGDQLVWGSFDWQDWFAKKPSAAFMNALDEERIHWEIQSNPQSNPQWDSWGGRVATTEHPEAQKLRARLATLQRRWQKLLDAEHYAAANALQLQIDDIEDELDDYSEPYNNPDDQGKRLRKAFQAGLKAGKKRQGGKPNLHGAELNAYRRGYRAGKKKEGWKIAPSGYSAKEWKKHLKKVAERKATSSKVSKCKHKGCTFKAKSGNYGFCGVHRRA